MMDRTPIFDDCFAAFVRSRPEHKLQHRFSTMNSIMHRALSSPEESANRNQVEIKRPRSSL